MAVLPSLMASREYSTWKRRPSGEKVLEGGREGLLLADGGTSEVGDVESGEEARRWQKRVTYLIPRSRCGC
jgi:hypothetical protein